MERKLLTAPWDRSGWSDEAHEWIRTQLAAQGKRVTGDIETVHTRPWSAVLRAPTDVGIFYFKALPDLYAHEVPLMIALEKWVPEWIPQVVATDTARHWMILGDAGQRLRETVRATRDVSPWFDILPQYAALQFELSKHVDELLAFGVPDYRPLALPAHLAHVLDDTAVLRIDQPDGLTADEHQRLRALAPVVAERCAQLAAMPIPNALDHGDFHDGNVFTKPGREGDHTLIDWGDCLVGHPFFSMRVVLVTNEISLDLPDLDPSLAPLRDAYLEAWQALAPQADVRAVFQIALWLANLAGALKWYSTVSNLSDAGREDFTVQVPSLLRDLLTADLDKYPYG